MDKRKPSLEVICDLLFADPDQVDEASQIAVNSERELDYVRSTATVASSQAETNPSYRRARELLGRKVLAAAKQSAFTSNPAVPGDVLLLNGLPNGKRLNTPIAIVLDQRVGLLGSSWSVWLASPYFEYATAYDRLFDDQPDVDPAMGMVLAWARSEIRLDTIETRLATLSASDLAGLRALHDEFLLQPALSSMLTPGTRTTLGGLALRTGTPLTDPADERAGFAQLYSICASELSLAFASQVQNPHWVNSLLDRLRAAGVAALEVLTPKPLMPGLVDAADGANRFVFDVPGIEGSLTVEFSLQEVTLKPQLFGEPENYCLVIFDALSGEPVLVDGASTVVIGTRDRVLKMLPGTDAHSLNVALVRLGGGLQS